MTALSRSQGQSGCLARILRRGVRRIVSCDKGSTTVEFVIWVPFFAGMLVAVADVSLVLATRANMWQVARETARAVARHEVAVDDATTYVRDHLLLGAPDNYSISVGETGDVTVQVSIPSAQASIFGIYGTLMTADLVATATRRSEPTDVVPGGGAG